LRKQCQDIAESSSIYAIIHRQSTATNAFLQRASSAHSLCLRH
jgi:hypothetical protein